MFDDASKDFVSIYGSLDLHRTDEIAQTHTGEYKWNENAEHCYNVVQRNFYSIDKEQQSK